MTEQELRDVVIETLKQIAPEIVESELRSDKPLRDQVDLDSMDWLNFLVGMHERIHVEIPEADYARLTTLNAIVDYLAKKFR